MYLSCEGFLHVYPYLHTQTTHIKSRWIGKDLHTVLSDEYRKSLPNALHLIHCGGVSVSGQPTTDPTFVFPRNARGMLSCLVHRHEPPILDAPSLGVVKGGPWWCVSKPPSWPIHPGGPHNRNSLTSIMEARGLWPSNPDGSRGTLHMLWRLDRLVSGLVAFAESPESCRQFLTMAESGGLHKVYCARLAGRLDPVVFSGPRRDGDGGGVAPVHHPPGTSWEAALHDWGLDWEEEEEEVGEKEGKGEEGGEDGSGMNVRVFVGGAGEMHWGVRDVLRRVATPHPPPVLTISYPLAPFPGRRGRFMAVIPPTAESGVESGGGGDQVAGKPCTTQLLVVGYNSESNTTDVLLRPLTGRTHQLRVHTAAIGFPIANCPVYGPPHDAMGWGSSTPLIPHISTPGARGLLREHVLRESKGGEGGEGEGQEEEEKEEEYKVGGGMPSPQRVAFMNCRFCKELFNGEGGKELEGGMQEQEGEEGEGGGEEEGEGEGDGDHSTTFPSFIFLHALAYSGKGVKMHAKLPEWW